MNILIDIGHPAHVHYFKNVIRSLEERGHKILVTSRDKDVAQKLLAAYGIPYKNRGRSPNSKYRKLFYGLISLLKITRYAIKFKPDLLLSVAPYTAIVSKVLGIPNIAVNDTENATFQNLIRDKLSDCVITPDAYKYEVGTKQVRFNGYLEMCSLHPNYFKPDDSVIESLCLNDKEKFVVLRFVAWTASHDIGHYGITNKMKKKIVNTLSEYAKVFISSEGDLPSELETYMLDIKPEEIHDILYYANLLFGESATMASEASILGTPSIYIDNVGRGYTDEQEEKFGLVHNFTEKPEDIQEALDIAVNLLSGKYDQEKWHKRRSNLLNNKIDVASFFVWFLENYPSSAKIMADEPNYQSRFI